jgi:hypothetical protein
MAARSLFYMSQQLARTGTAWHHECAIVHPMSLVDRGARCFPIPDIHHENTRTIGDGSPLAVTFSPEIAQNAERSVSEAGRDMAPSIAAIALTVISRYSRREQM